MRIDQGDNSPNYMNTNRRFFKNRSSAYLRRPGGLDKKMVDWKLFNPYP
jgi:hypothetical protein